MNNGEIKLTINSLGAEMIDLQLVKDDLEYLWRADPLVWGRQTPVLFPIVGRLKDNSYQVANQQYSMTQHGFARDNEFELIAKDSEWAQYKFSSNEDTLKVYPFEFELWIDYRLLFKRVKINYTVINKNKEEMLFSLGAHPGFNCPLEKDLTIEDYYLEFAQEETAAIYLLEKGLVKDKRINFLENEKGIRMTKDLFKNDALIFRGLNSKTISLKSDKSDRMITVDFNNFPYLGIWSQSDGAPFVCVEPWYGIADFTDATGKLEDKVAVQQLSPGKEFNCWYSIEIN